jgi:hypothetical protein
MVVSFRNVLPNKSWRRRASWRGRSAGVVHYSKSLAEYLPSLEEVVVLAASSIDDERQLRYAAAALA